jgi:hypothetical protein
MAIRHSSHARHDLWYHFAWSTKYRKKVWTDDAKRESVKRLFRKIAFHYDMEIGAIELCSGSYSLYTDRPAEDCSVARSTDFEEREYESPV